MHPSFIGFVRIGCVIGFFLKRSKFYTINGKEIQRVGLENRIFIIIVGIAILSYTLQFTVHQASAVVANEIDMATGSGSDAGAPCVADNNCYAPNPLHVYTGTTVTWNDTDTTYHTVTSGKISDSHPGSLFDSGNFFHNQIFQFTFTNTGVYDYFCAVHPWMTGQVIVDAVPSFCSPSVTGDWVISSSCSLQQSASILGNVIVQTGTVLTIPNGVTLSIPFSTNHLVVKSGGGVLVKAGGKID